MTRTKEDQIMGKNVYFDRKYDAENARRLMEEATGQKATLQKS